MVNPDPSAFDELDGSIQEAVRRRLNPSRWWQSLSVAVIVIAPLFVLLIGLLGPTADRLVNPGEIEKIVENETADLDSRIGQTNEEIQKLEAGMNEEMARTQSELETAINKRGNAVGRRIERFTNDFKERVANVQTITSDAQSVGEDLREQLDQTRQALEGELGGVRGAASAANSRAERALDSVEGSRQRIERLEEELQAIRETLDRVLAPGTDYRSFTVPLRQSTPLVGLPLRLSPGKHRDGLLRDFKIEDSSGAQIYLASASGVRVGVPIDFTYQGRTYQIVPKTILYKWGRDFLDLDVFSQGETSSAQNVR